MLLFISFWLFIGPHLLSTKTSRIINSMLAVYFIVPEMFFPVWAFIRGISQMGQYSKYFCMIADRMRLELNYLLTYSLKFLQSWKLPPPPTTFQGHSEIEIHFYFTKPQYYPYVWSWHRTNNVGGGVHDLDLWPQKLKVTIEVTHSVRHPFCFWSVPVSHSPLFLSPCDVAPAF